MRAYTRHTRTNRADDPVASQGKHLSRVRVLKKKEHHKMTGAKN